MLPVTGSLSPVFETYLKELINWNKKFNLTAITDPKEIRIKHFADSLSLLEHLKLTTESVIDVGAGAGFPGIPLKIACPGIKLTLLEATRKKTDFIKHIISVLNLKNVEVMWGRAEEVAKNKRESYDLAVSRAVAKLNILVEFCLPFVKVGGLFVAYKEDKVEAEVKQALKSFEILGGKLKDIKKVKLADTGIVRSLVFIEKISATPPRYPRASGIVKKRPL